MFDVYSAEVIAIYHCHHDCHSHSVSPFSLSTPAPDEDRITRKRQRDSNREREAEKDAQLEGCRKNALNANLFSKSNLKSETWLTLIHLGRYQDAVKKKKNQKKEEAVLSASQLYMSESAELFVITSSS